MHRYLRWEIRKAQWRNDIIWNEHLGVQKVTQIPRMLVGNWQRFVGKTSAIHPFSSEMQAKKIGKTEIEETWNNTKPKHQFEIVRSIQASQHHNTTTQHRTENGHKIRRTVDECNDSTYEIGSARQDTIDGINKTPALLYGMVIRIYRISMQNNFFLQIVQNESRFVVGAW